MADKEIADKMIKARATLLLDMPFFGALSLRLRLVPMSDQIRQEFIAHNNKPTLGVDGICIYYDEEFIRSLTLNLTRSVIAHEVGHCVFEHIIRRGNRNPDKWNRAGDFKVNQMLVEAGMEIGPEWLRDQAYDNMHTDQIYDLLSDNPNGSSKGLCEIMDSKLDSAQQKEMQNEWKIAGIQAANAALGQSQGSTKSFLKKFLNEIIVDKINWGNFLIQWVKHRSKEEYTWMRANRRFIHTGLYLPSMHSFKFGKIVVVLDTSGSIWQSLLERFIAHIKDIRNIVRPSETIYIECDTDIRRVKTFTLEDEFQISKIRGGGGTCFRPPFEYLDKNNIEPECMVYLTDGYGYFPDSAPLYPVLWAMTTGVVPPFGEYIRIPAGE